MDFSVALSATKWTLLVPPPIAACGSTGCFTPPAERVLPATPLLPTFAISSGLNFLGRPTALGNFGGSSVRGPRLSSAALWLARIESADRDLLSLIILICGLLRHANEYYIWLSGTPSLKQLCLQISFLFTVASCGCSFWGSDSQLIAKRVGVKVVTLNGCKIERVSNNRKCVNDPVARP